MKPWGDVGLDAAKFAQDVSTLVGAHYVGRDSYSKSKEGFPQRFRGA